MMNTHQMSKNKIPSWLSNVCSNQLSRFIRAKNGIPDCRNDGDTEALTCEEHSWFSGLALLLGFTDKAASHRHPICVVQAGWSWEWYYHPRSQTLLSTLFNINAQGLPVGMTKGHPGGERPSGRQPHSRDSSSQKRLNVDFHAGAGHGQLKLGDNVRMKDSQLPDALTPGQRSPHIAQGRTQGLKDRESSCKSVFPCVKMSRHLTPKAC